MIERHNAHTGSAIAALWHAGVESIDRVVSVPGQSSQRVVQDSEDFTAG